MSNGSAPAPGGDTPRVPETFEPDTYYLVQLLRPILVGRKNLSPNARQRLLGSFCQEHRDDIYEATPDDG